MMLLAVGVSLVIGMDGKKYDVQPDIAALGKSLTAGYTPLGCSVANKKVGDVIKNKDWEFGHTWQPTMTGISDE